jgi:hypothetical protein
VVISLLLPAFGVFSGLRFMSIIMIPDRRGAYNEKSRILAFGWNRRADVSALLDMTGHVVALFLSH